ncbi:MAG: 1-acyl-sn-glycerol-3-phosphate acyltransferase, partial [Aquificota bacterium]
MEKYYSELGYKIWFKLKPIIKFILRIKVEGSENFPSKPGFIIASNHRSHLDPPIINTISPFPVMFMAKKELFEIPIIGNFIKKAGAIPVERRKGGTKALIKALDLLEKKHVVGIFPEGTRANPGQFLKPQKGVGLLVSKANVPVIPVKINGTDKIFPKKSK